ncbi:MAG TPA: hypothetical protein EYP19_04920, partial [Desulfobacterales bacterium]|nr:hypothetical protein [Desulfobacterales bacterium]
MILEHLLETDQQEPYLRDVYPLLDARARGRLMAAIETAKIQASTTGTGVILQILRFKRGQKEATKLVNYTLEEAQLAEIVAPVIGRCRYLIEESLLNSAKRQIDRVLIIGAGARM